MVFPSPHETEKNRRLRNGKRPERSKFAAFHTPVLTPDVIVLEIDMFPAERREVLKRSRTPNGVGQDPLMGSTP
jgi:hypothetical protein